MTLAEFINHWQKSTLTESSASQSHFSQLCAVLDKPNPTSDLTGQDYTFQKAVTKTDGKPGFADVWKRNQFAWEYKGKKKNLAEAYQQLLGYREALGNPPLLVVCDLDRFEVHINFTNTDKKVFAFRLADLAKNEPTLNCALPPLDVLRALFEDTDKLRPDKINATITEAAARKFGELARSLQGRGHEPHSVSRFLIRLLFCLFAEDVGLLPEYLFSALVEKTRLRPEEFGKRVGLLFGAMANGGSFGIEDIKRFNGGLFTDADVLPLTKDDLAVLAECASLHWASIEPSIFGTLFERSLDPNNRARLGAHYTSRDDILLVVEPVLMAPLRRRWAEVQALAEALVAKRASTTGAQKVKLTGDINKMLQGFCEELEAVRVLDPACGSGNFLYVALRALLDLEKDVITYAISHDAGGFFHRVGPEQMRGLEMNEYAHELAPITVNIGYIQWLQDNAGGSLQEPILRHMDTIHEQDAILAHGADGTLEEPEWPEADVIIGNPPFLGGNRIRQELGGSYVDALFQLYEGRVPAFSDLVCYWFEKARALVEEGQVKRVGLIATQSIRGGVNRRVLDRIKETGDIFWAQSDREWVLNGADVHVSMVGFDNGTEAARELDGAVVKAINADLTGAIDLTGAAVLPENASICFMGPSPKGPFDVDEDLAKTMLDAPVNVNGRPNSDVVRPVVSSTDIGGRPRHKWTIDFGAMPLEEAQQYELPFEYLKRTAYEKRSQIAEKGRAAKWWQYARFRPEMRKALAGLDRFIATGSVGKHRHFIWVEPEVLCNQGTCVFARADDYAFGVLHSRAHELWARIKGTQLRERESGFRYTSTTTFETFPFPWPLGQEPVDDPEAKAIAKAASALVDARQSWLNPPRATPAELAERTLNNLYNSRPTWLDTLHTKLDSAVLAAYGWPALLTDAELLERLLALNQARAGDKVPPTADSEGTEGKFP